jgi:hypothetical protein
MRSASRSAFTTLALLAPALILLLPPAPVVDPGDRPAAATVEPAPPLLVDLRPGPVESDGPGAWRADLEIELSAGPPIRILAFDLILPAGVRPAAAAWPAAPDAGELGPGEIWSRAVPLGIGRPGALPIRIEIEYALLDGRRFRSLQGATLRVATAPPGRHHAGAYEVMASPPEEWLAR